MKYEARLDGGGRTHWWFWCPGCEDVHGISDGWEVTETEDGLDVSPSILVIGPGRYIDDMGTWEAKEIRCHSYLRRGQWQFLVDSTHHLSGKTVEMVDLPRWWPAVESAASPPKE